MTAEEHLAFELARMFPAHKPSEILLLPTKYYLSMREYYMQVKRAEAKAMARQSGQDYDVPGFNVIDFDKATAEGKPI